MAMNTKQLTELVAKGAQVLVGQLRSGYEVVNSPKKQANGSIVPGQFTYREKCKILFRNDVVECSRFMDGPDNHRGSESPKEGDMVVWEFKDFGRNKYGCQSMGVILDKFTP